jgi:hypothetical protein
MTDEALIEAAARALYEHDTVRDAYDWNYAGEPERNNARKLAVAVLAAVAPLIRAAALEEAIKAIESALYADTRDEAIDVLRALK